MSAPLRIWAALMALTLATTLLAGWGGPLIHAALLAVALAKAGTILGGFMGLCRAPGWLGAFLWPLGIWLGLLWGLYAL